MELKEQIIRRYVRNIRQSKVNLKKAERQFEDNSNHYDLAKRVINNIESLKRMTDEEVRRFNLPKIMVTDCPDSIFLEDAREAGSDYIVDYNMSRRLCKIRRYIEKKYHEVYQSGETFDRGFWRELKKGHSEEEFDFGIWDVWKNWINQYRKREMKEDLYNSLMKDNFETIYQNLIEKIKK